VRSDRQKDAGENAIENPKKANSSKAGSTTTTTTPTTTITSRSYSVLFDAQNEQLSKKEQLPNKLTNSRKKRNETTRKNSEIMSKEHAQTPPDGLECLVTMEDITAEDGNYGELFHGRGR
jgi:hypothetical protein